MKKKRSLWLLISGVIATIYILYLLIYYGSLVSSTEGVAHETAVTLAVFAAPHLVITAIAVVFNWFAVATNVRVLAFSSGVVYIIACIAGILYIPSNLIILVSAVLSFIGFAKFKKVKSINDIKKNIDEK